MASTLASVRDRVEINLSDSSNLVWSTAVIDEAIRSALVDLSRVYGDDLTLKDLDAALTTTFEEIDVTVLIIGAVAYALMFRSVGRYEEVTPEPAFVPSFAQLANHQMQSFFNMLQSTNHRLKEVSSNAPFSEWVWEEGSDF